MKKLLSCLVLCAVLLLNYNIAYAYQIKTKDGKYILPLNKVTYYYIASNCDTSAIAPIQNGMSTWNAAPPTTFKLNLVNANKSNYRYNISNPQDYINTIGTAMTVTEMAILNPSAIAFNSILYGLSDYLIIESDIGYNTGFSFGVNGGPYDSFYDWQGVFTHELGHTIGLTDIYDHSGYLNTLPTMYGQSSWQQYNPTLVYYPNIFIYLRDLADDDKNGKAYVASIRGF